MLKIIIILLEIIEKSDFACPYVPPHVIIIIRGSMETYFSEGHPIGRVILSKQQKSSPAISLPIVLQQHSTIRPSAVSLSRNVCMDLTMSANSHQFNYASPH